jgi:hypothetical protein
MPRTSQEIEVTPEVATSASFLLRDLGLRLAHGDTIEVTSHSALEEHARKLILEFMSNDMSDPLGYWVIKKDWEVINVNT